MVAHFESGKRVVGDALLYTMGRQGNTDSLDLGAVGLEADRRGLLEVCTAVLSKPKSNQRRTELGIKTVIETER